MRMAPGKRKRLLAAEDDDSASTSSARKKAKAEQAKKPVQLNAIQADLEFWKVNLKSLLSATPIAVAIANNLPMKSLNSFGQVNKYLSSICRQAKNHPLRHAVAFIHRPNFSVDLGQGQLVKKLFDEESLFADHLRNLYCEPAFVFAFCSASVMFGHSVLFQSTRIPLEGRFNRKTYFAPKDVARIIADSMPLAIGGKGVDNLAVVHFRTNTVLPPVPLPPSGNQRKSDPHGVKDSPRDMVLLAIPHIPGVKIWRERRTDKQMAQRLREGGFRRDPSRSDFLQPLLVDLNALGAKLAFVFTKRFPYYQSVSGKEFPIVVVSSLQQKTYEGFGLLDDPLSEYRYDIVAIGGKVVAYQVVLSRDLSPSSRAMKIDELRELFTTEQVMQKQMMIFVYQTGGLDYFTPFERDVEQLRERFPKVPIFGGSYLDAVGNVYTADRNGCDFGTFHAGVNYVIVCAVVLG